MGEVVNEQTGELRQYHRFMLLLPRLRTESAVCDNCDIEVLAHAGPVSSRSNAFPIR